MNAAIAFGDGDGGRFPVMSSHVGGVVTLTVNVAGTTFTLDGSAANMAAVDVITHFDTGHDTILLHISAWVDFNASSLTRVVGSGDLQESDRRRPDVRLLLVAAQNTF